MNKSGSFRDEFRTGGGSVAFPAPPYDTRNLARRADFRLGAATVRPSIRTVEGPGGSAAAEPRVMQVLLALVDAEGNVLTRDDLIQICWNGQIVGDDAINRAIKEVRRIARETEAGFAIETIQRVGFRLTAEDGSGVRPVADEAAASANAHDHSSLSRRGLLIGGAVAAAAGVFAVARPFLLSDRTETLIEESQAALRLGSKPGEEKAIALLEKAVAQSPDSARAWGLLALTRARVDEHAISTIVSKPSQVEAAASRALALDPGNADAAAAQAIMTPYFGDWIGAERRFDTILAKHPDHLFTQDSRLFFYGAVGRMRESGVGRNALASAAEQDANMLYRQVYGLWFQNRIAEADRTAFRGLEIWPGHAGIWFARLWVLAGTQRFERALAFIGETIGRPPLPPPMLETLRFTMQAALTGKKDNVEAASQRIIGGVSKSVAGVVNGFMLLNVMGALDQVFALANAYYLERGPILPAMQWRPGQPSVPDQRRRKTNMLFTPIAAPMQRDPRFLPLMQEIGLADYWKQRGVTPDFLAARRG